MTTTTTPTVTMIDPANRQVPPFGGFSWAFLGIELKRVFKNSGTIIFSIGFPIAMLFFVALPNRHLSATDLPVAKGGISAAVPIMLSMALYGAMVASTMVGASVAAERSQGWSRQLRLTPLNPVVYIVVKIVCGMVVGGLGVLVTLIVGTVIGIIAPVGDLVVSGLIAWSSSLMLTSLGLTVGYAFPAQNAMRYLGPILPILSFMGGLFFPLEFLPHIAQTVAKFTPLWGIADLVQKSAIGAPLSGWSLFSLVFWFIVFSVLAVLMFRRDTKRV